MIKTSFFPFPTADDCGDSSSRTCCRRRRRRRAPAAAAGEVSRACVDLCELLTPVKTSSKPQSVFSRLAPLPAGHMTRGRRGSMTIGSRVGLNSDSSRGRLALELPRSVSSPPFSPLIPPFLCASPKLQLSLPVPPRPPLSVSYHTYGWESGPGSARFFEMRDKIRKRTARIWWGHTVWAEPDTLSSFCCSQLD